MWQELTFEKQRAYFKCLVPRVELYLFHSKERINKDKLIKKTKEKPERLE